MDRKAADIGGLTDDFGCGEGPTAADLKQGGSDLVHLFTDLDVQGFNLLGETDAALQEPTSQASNGPCLPGQVGGDLGYGLGPVEGASWRIPARVEFVQMPSQPVDDPCPFRHTVLTVVDQEPNIASGPIEAGDGQIGFLQGHPGDSQGVDEV